MLAPEVKSALERAGYKVRPDNARHRLRYQVVHLDNGVLVRLALDGADAARFYQSDAGKLTPGSLTFRKAADERDRPACPARASACAEARCQAHEPAASRDRSGVCASVLGLAWYVIHSGPGSFGTIDMSDDSRSASASDVLAAAPAGVIPPRPARSPRPGPHRRSPGSSKPPSPRNRRRPRRKPRSRCDGRLGTLTGRPSTSNASG